MIRRMIAGATVRVGRVVATEPPRPTPARPSATGITGPRVAIPGFNPSDPKLAKILAELEAKRPKDQTPTGPNPHHRPRPAPRLRRPARRKGGAP